MILEPEEHGSATCGKYLITLLFRGDKLIDNQSKSNLASSKQTPGRQQTDRPAVEQYIKQFARLRQSFQQEQRMLFVVAEVRSLDPGPAWQRLYVSAVKRVGCPCPVLVWHPKRNKHSVLDCNFAERTKHVLEQALDGNVTSWTVQSWPT